MSLVGVISRRTQNRLHLHTLSKRTLIGEKSLSPQSHVVSTNYVLHIVPYCASSADSNDRYDTPKHASSAWQDKCTILRPFFPYMISPPLNTTIWWIHPASILAEQQRWAVPISIVQYASCFRYLDKTVSYPHDNRPVGVSVIVFEPRQEYEHVAFWIGLPHIFSGGNSLRKGYQL